MHRFIDLKKQRRAVVAVFITLLVMSAGLVRQAQAQAGGASVVFLMIEPDSRAAGMGNTGVAVADNANAIFWNPAGLAYQRGTEAGITHANWLPELNAGLFYEYLVGKHHVEGVGTFGGHITFLNLGEHEQRSPQGEKLGTFRSYDVATGLSYSTKISERFAIGVSSRLIYSKLAGTDIQVGNQTANPGISLGVDLSGLYRSQPLDLGGVNTTASAGFNLANMGPSIQYVDNEQSDPIPTNLRFGYALTFDFDEYNSLTLANDFNKMLIDRDSTGAKPWYQAIFSSWQPVEVDQTPNNDEDELQRLSVVDQLIIGSGAEYWYRDLFALRGGYFYENPANGDRQFLTFGAGIRYNLIGVDFSYIYALKEDHPLANTMRFTLMVDFAK